MLSGARLKVQAEALAGWLHSVGVRKAQPDDVIAWARERMTAYKVPKVVQFVDHLSKSGSGKVMWRLLQDQQDVPGKPG